MYSNERYSRVRNDDDLESKEEFDEKQHLSDNEMQKLRNVIKTKIAGELTISKKYYFQLYLIKVQRVYSEFSFN